MRLFYTSNWNRKALSIGILSRTVYNLMSQKS